MNRSLAKMFFLNSSVDGGLSKGIGTLKRSEIFFVTIFGIYSYITDITDVNYQFSFKRISNSFESLFLIIVSPEKLLIIFDFYHLLKIILMTNLGRSYLLNNFLYAD